LDWLEHSGGNLEQVGELKVQGFLVELAVGRGVAAATQNQGFSALLFFFGKVLSVHWAKWMHCGRSGRRGYR
jgi:hypothetical protein